MNAFRKYIWHAAWPAVLALNLIVPLLLGLAVTSYGGRWGMGMAIVLIWVAGHVGFARFKELGPVLVAGGILVALLQLFPYLQIMSGMLGVAFVSIFDMDLGGNEPMPNGLTELGGFLATLLTSVPLLLVAWGCGIVIREIAYALVPRRQSWSAGANQPPPEFPEF